MKIFDIELNLKNSETVRTNIEVNSGDVGGVEFRFRIKDDQTEIKYSNYSKFSYIALKPDMKQREGIIINSGTHLMYTLTAQDIVAPGMITAGVALYDADNKRVTTRYFSFFVENDLISENRMRSSDQFDSLINVVKDAESVADEIREILGILQDEVFVTFPYLHNYTIDGGTFTDEIEDAPTPREFVTFSYFKNYTIDGGHFDEK